MFLHPGGEGSLSEVVRHVQFVPSKNILKIHENCTQFLKCARLAAEEPTTDPCTGQTRRPTVTARPVTPSIQTTTPRGPRTTTTPLVVAPGTTGSHGQVIKPVISGEDRAKYLNLHNQFRRLEGASNMQELVCSGLNWFQLSYSTAMLVLACFSAGMECWSSQLSSG